MSLVNAAAEVAQLSEVDSLRFGARVARAYVSADDVCRVWDFCRDSGVDLLIARCKTGDLRAAQEMEKFGSFLTDTLVYYSFDLIKRAIPDDSPRAVIRKIAPGDEHEVGSVAARAFRGYYGHYHADPNLDPAKCDEGYVSWAVRSCSKEIANEVLIAEYDHAIVGFATLRANSAEEGEGVLFAVAPEAQGVGIYRSFMIQAMNWCKDEGLKRMVVSTQVTNVAVQKVWCRVGFEPANSYYTFHKWFSSGGGNGIRSSSAQ